MSSLQTVLSRSRWLNGGYQSREGSQDHDDLSNVAFVILLFEQLLRRLIPLACSTRRRNSAENHLQRTRPQRSRQQVRQCRRPQRSRQHRRHETSVTLLTLAVTPAANGGIGAAWADPYTAARTKPATDIPSAVRNMCLSLFYGVIRRPRRHETWSLNTSNPSKWAGNVGKVTWAGQVGKVTKL